MKKALVFLQIAIVALVIVYGTVSLYLGNFEGAFATLPFLMLCYVYVAARQRRVEREKESNED